MGQWFTRKVIRGQVWVKFVKKESNRAVCIQYTYVLTPDLIIAMSDSNAIFLNFFRISTGQGTKGGWDESIHVYMILCCK